MPHNVGNPNYFMEKARAWLYRPLKRFDERRPLDLIQAGQGEALAEEALWQIDEGMFS